MKTIKIDLYTAAVCIPVPSVLQKEDVEDGGFTAESVANNVPSYVKYQDLSTLQLYDLCPT